ncbi:MAG: adenylate/guanylate cyclase domain-containing protein [Bacteroidetes bacterium]|nr:adenylate/guanylate cyclase domain-containing protein [Bacteroidota bacterium]
MVPVEERKFQLKRYTGIIIALIVVLLIELLFNTLIVHEIFGTSFFQSVERRSLDMLMRFRGERDNADNTIMIGIDESTYNEFGYPIPHDQYGVVMTLLSNSGARAVALDVFLTDKQKADSSESLLLVEYLSLAQNTYQVFGPFIPSKTERENVNRKDVDSTAHFVMGKFGIPAPQRHHFPRAPYIEAYPFPELAEVSTGVVHALCIQDSIDGVLRSMPLYVEYAGRLYPALGFALALKTLKIEPKQVRFEDTEEGTVVYAGPLVIHTGLWGEVLINYIGKSESFPLISFLDILSAAKESDSTFFNQFRGKVCIIGPTLRSVGDYYPTPVDESAPGFYTHANVYDMIVTDSFITRAPAWIQFIILLILTLIIGYYTHRRHIKVGIFVLAVVTLLFLTVVVIAFTTEHLWINIVAPLTSFVICFVATVAYKAATEGRQRKLITSMFGTYVDSNVVRILINNPSLAKLGGEKHEVSVLFTDIKGFSGISEKVSEDVLVKLLNVYFTDMTNVILANGGAVDKFIGDSIMAFWGAPIPDSDSAYHACVTAVQMQSQLEKLQTKLMKIGGVGIKHRIGINTGSCIVGNMGSEQKKNYTVTGDPVNLASRLEGVNKQYGTGILISEYTQKKAINRLVTRLVDKVQVVGKTEPVQIFELMGIADKPLDEKTKFLLDIYGQGIKAYQERRWDEGIAFMLHALEKFPDDPVCQLYIERMKLFQINPPANDWNGVFVLQSK